MNHCWESRTWPVWAVSAVCRKHRKCHGTRIWKKKQRKQHKANERAHSDVPNVKQLACHIHSEIDILLSSIENNNIVMSQYLWLFWAFIHDFVATDPSETIQWGFVASSIENTATNSNLSFMLINLKQVTHRGGKKLVLVNRFECSRPTESSHLACFANGLVRRSTLIANYWCGKDISHGYTASMSLIEMFSCLILWPHRITGWLSPWISLWLSWNRLWHMAYLSDVSPCSE